MSPGHGASREGWLCPWEGWLCPTLFSHSIHVPVPWQGTGPGPAPAGLWSRWDPLEALPAEHRTGCRGWMRRFQPPSAACTAGGREPPEPSLHLRRCRGAFPAQTGRAGSTRGVAGPRCVSVAFGVRVSQRGCSSGTGAGPGAARGAGLGWGFLSSLLNCSSGVQVWPFFRGEGGAGLFRVHGQGEGLD